MTFIVHTACVNNKSQMYLCDTGHSYNCKFGVIRTFIRVIRTFIRVILTFIRIIRVIRTFILVIQVILVILISISGAEVIRTHLSKLGYPDTPNHQLSGLSGLSGFIHTPYYVFINRCFPATNGCKTTSL